MILALALLTCAPFLFVLAYRGQWDARIPWDRYRNAGIYFAGALVALFVFTHVLYSPISAYDWNARRLMASFVLVAGEKLFPNATEGLYFMGLNGPIPPLLYAPAALGASPLAAVWIGVFLSALFVLVPTWLLVSEGRSRTTALFTMVGAVAMILTIPGLDRSTFRVHADAPAMLFSGLSLWQLHRWGTEGKLSSLLWASALAPLAFFSKISFAPSVVILLSYLWLRRASLRNFGIALGTMGIVSSLVVFWGIFISHENGFFWGLLISASQSYKVNGVTNAPTNTMMVIIRKIGLNGLEIIRDHFALFGLGTGLFLLSAPKRRDELPRLSWLLFLASVCFFPAAVVGRSRYGAESNVLTPCLFFFTVGLWRVFFDETRVTELGSALRKVRVAVLVILLVPFAAELYGILWPLRELKTCRDKVTADRLRDGADIYFPDYPLSHYLTQRRLYHAGTVIAEMNMGSYPISDQQFFAYAPRHPKVIAIDSPGSQRMVARYFADYRRGKPIEGLTGEGWEIFVPKDSPEALPISELASGGGTAQNVSTPPLPKPQ